MSSIAITSHLFQDASAALELLNASGHDVRLALDVPKNRESYAALLNSTDGLIAGTERIDADLLASARRLRVIARPGAGFENVDVPSATRLGIVVSNSPGLNATSVAEMAFGLMLALGRRIVANHEAVASDRWSRQIGEELADRTIGILGLGAIGHEVAARAKAFRMNVIAHTRTPRPERDTDIRFVSQADLFRLSDVLVLTAPHVPELVAVVRAETIDLMPRGAWIISCARGAHVNLDDLHAALISGQIGGAALDVYPAEPWFDRRFILPNVVLSPHVGGETVQSRNRMTRRAAESVLRVLRGEPPESLVNPDAWPSPRTNVAV